jgi:Uncharacterized conserved protein
VYGLKYRDFAQIVAASRGDAPSRQPRCFPVMKKFILSLLAIVPLQVAVFAQSTWKADPAHSRIGFSITHLGISDVSGAFDKFEATITSDKTDFSDAVFELTINADSINTAVDKRDEHLRSPDFFEVTKFPKITFRSRSIRSIGPDRYQLEGELTIRDVAKPVTAELWYRGATDNPMSKKRTAGFQLTAKLKRSDFGVGPKFQPPMISDELLVKADGEFVKQ